MKRTFHLFSLAIIVSLLLSAVGLPLIPVQAAGATANLEPTGVWGKLLYPSAPTIANPTGVTNDSTPTVQGTADPGNRVTVWYEDSTTGEWVRVCENLLADSITGDWTCPWPAAPFLAIATGNFSLKAKAFDGTNYSPDTIVDLELNPIGPNCIEYTLTVTSAHGIVTKKPNKATYRYGEIVQLMATPAMGWSFANWTGNATGMGNPVSIFINGNKAVTANYIQNEYTLTITSAHGNVIKNPDQATYHYGDIVTLTTAPTIGWAFANWTGSVTSAANPVSITMDGDKTVTANYIQNGGYTLTVTSAHGNVIKNPDQATYHYGEVVTLTVVPAIGWSFANWTGNVTSAQNPVSITMDGDKAITANYIQNEYTLTIHCPYGKVTRTPDKATYSFGEVVQLKVTDNHDWLFVNWTGDMAATTNPLAITMDSNKTITANFIQRGPDTVGVFRPTTTTLYLNNKNETGFADFAVDYGLPGDYPVVGDWDDDGDTTIGVYRNGYFYLRNENTIGFADWVFPFGQSGDQPIAGDWDGNGTDTIGIYRPSTGQFLLRNSNSGGVVEISFFLGNPGDVGIAGDWDGDGIDTTGVFRPSNGLIFLKNRNEPGLADVTLNYGFPHDKPVTGDWNDDGVDTIGVYRNNTFYLHNSNTNGFAELVFILGWPGDMPIAGNWDGLP